MYIHVVIEHVDTRHLYEYGFSVANRVSTEVLFSLPAEYGIF